MTAHSCSHNACTVSMRTAHRREARRARRGWTSAVVAAAGIALLVLGGAVGIGYGLGGVW